MRYAASPQFGVSGSHWVCFEFEKPSKLTGNSKITNVKIPFSRFPVVLLVVVILRRGGGPVGKGKGISGQQVRTHVKMTP